MLRRCPDSTIPLALFLFVFTAALVPALTACRQRRLPEVDTSSQDLAVGRLIFERRCASCHNSSGNGDTITASRLPFANLIDGKWRGDGSLASIQKQIREGHDPMPKFEGKLTSEEIRRAAGYVLALAEANARARP